jgi:hypothetical protein
MTATFDLDVPVDPPCGEAASPTPVHSTIWRHQRQGHQQLAPARASGRPSRRVARRSARGPGSSPAAASGRSTSTPRWAASLGLGLLTTSRHGGWQKEFRQSPQAQQRGSEEITSGSSRSRAPAPRGRCRRRRARLQRATLVTAGEAGHKKGPRQRREPCATTTPTSLTVGSRPLDSDGRLAIEYQYRVDQGFGTRITPARATSTCRRLAPRVPGQST